MRAQAEESRESLWTAIRGTKGAPFKAEDLAWHTRLEMPTIREYLAGLTRAGYLEKEDSPAFQARTYRLVRDTGADAPRVRRDGTEVTQGRGREQMWRTMRILGEFSPRELAVSASTEEAPVAPGEAHSYVGHLCRAGYLRRTANGRPGHRAGTGTQARYRFLRHMHTGPKPPQVQRNRQVYDPNLRRTMTGGTT